MKNKTPEIYTESERAYRNRLNLAFVADTLPRLIEKIIPGMPIRFSRDEKYVLETAAGCIQYEIERRAKLGRNLSDNPSDAALKMRKSRAKKRLD